MKRIFAVLFMLMFLFIPSAFAAQPDISSDSQTFNPFTGVYDLKGHVHVDLGDRVIDGDAAQVYLYQLEVHAQGNISPALGFVINPFGGNIVVTREMVASMIAAKLKAAGRPVPPAPGTPGAPTQPKQQ